MDAKTKLKSFVSVSVSKEGKYVKKWTCALIAIILLFMIALPFGGTAEKTCAHEKLQEQVTEPTCTSAGKRQWVCSQCGAEVKTETIPALGHNIATCSIVRMPTESENGLKRCECSRCGYYEDEILPKLPCSHGNTQEQVTQPTCTDPGKRQVICSNCGVLLKTETIPALGHDMGIPLIVREPTDLKEGLRWCECSRCGYIKEEIVPKLEKTGKSWLNDQSVSVAGIRYSEILPDLTDTWYMFVPLDLSQEGEEEYPLLAANASVIGSVQVKAANGKVTVSYLLAEEVKDHGLSFALLPDIASVTDVNEIDCTGFAFGRAIDIQETLKGNTRVLLHVTGNVDYPSGDDCCSLFDENSAEYQTLKEQLKSRMDETK